MNETKYIDISNNSLARYMISRNYFYTMRYKDKDTGRYTCRFVDSPLFQELVHIYNGLNKEERNSYSAKYTQKAE